MKRKLSTSGVDPGAARRPGQNRRSVLEQLDAPVERPAVDHVESDIGIAVVAPLPAAASGDEARPALGSRVAIKRGDEVDEKLWHWGLRGTQVTWVRDEYRS